LNIFLDSSVAIAASLSATGASRELFDFAARHDWSLVISPWVLREIRDNLRDRSDAAREWKSLRRGVIIETDEFIFEWPLLFEIAKDSRCSLQRSHLRMFFSRLIDATLVR
jgi:hypothetical protein